MLMVPADQGGAHGGPHLQAAGDYHMTPTFKIPETAVAKTNINKLTIIILGRIMVLLSIGFYVFVAHPRA